MATTKLRKSFKYPVETSDVDDSPEALDEEEQEKLIAKMRAENQERNDEYLRLFLALPLVTPMTFLPAIATSSLYQVKFLSFICISSLLATGYMLVFVSFKKPDNRRRESRDPDRFEPATGPIAQYLPYLNGALSFLLALNAVDWRGRGGVHPGFWILCFQPAFVFFIIVAVKKIMLDVDIDELEDLKYGYKGADKPSYKVVLEEVTQKKKKLITAGSFHVNPPPGYTFIPAGDPQITNRCKDIARKDGAKVYTVSTTKHKHSGLSKEVHRIGYHFPSSVVGRACLSLGVDLSSDGRVLRHQHDWIADRLRPKHQHGTRLNVLAHNTSNTKMSQASIDTQAREAIKDLFPKMPDKDLRDIVTHAFELGKSRVGTAPELPLPRRVQLAVVAHIRHTYTDYDNLLREVPWNAARAMIEQASLNKLAQWRGDDDDEPDAMEDILREIIVIPDDDEEEDPNEADTGTAQRQYADRHDSVEIVTSRNIVDNMETRPIDYSNLREGTEGAESLESDDDHEVIFLGHGQYFLDRPDQAKSKRNRDHRHRAWEEARDRFRYPIAEPRSRPLRQLPQAIGITSNVHVRRNSYEHTGSLLPQEYRPSDQKIMYIREDQPLSNLSVDQATHQSIADSKYRGSIYSEQTRSLAPLINPFEPVGRQETSQDIPREYQRIQNVPTQSSAPTNRGYVEHESVDRVELLRTDPTSHDQVRVPNHCNQRLPQSPPSQAENVLQSIEKPIYSLSHIKHSERPLYAHSPVRVRQLDNFEPRREPDFHRVRQDLNEEQQLVKRRRTNQGHDKMHDPNNDLQRSLLIPVSHTDRHEFSDRAPDMLHRINGSGAFVETDRVEGAYAMHKIVEFNQENVPRHGPLHSEHVPSNRTYVPRHGQVLIPQQKTSSCVSAMPPVERLVYTTVPKFDEYHSAQNVSYVPRSSHVSLPRTSHVIADHVNRRTTQGLLPWDENVRTSRPVFGQTSEVKGNLPPYGVNPQLKSLSSAEQSGIYLVRESPMHIQANRARRLLPLERSFEQLRPVRERVPGVETDRLEDSLEDNVFDQVIGVTDIPKSQIPWPQIHLQRDLTLDHVGHGEKQRPFDTSLHQGNRVHEMYQSSVEPRRKPYLKEVSREMISEFHEPMVRIPSLSEQRRLVLDKRTGREVIVLE
ncbi:hypothetical protein MMC11_004956 [Xylographa trunciseda]|nr:hypothetical protein [Xylographa trunciseda]